MHRKQNPTLVLSVNIVKICVNIVKTRANEISTRANLIKARVKLRLPIFPLASDTCSYTAKNKFILFCLNYCSIIRILYVTHAKLLYE